jgi:hypothetical protein
MNLALLLPTLLCCKLPDQDARDSSASGSLQEHLGPACQRIHDLVAAFRAAPVTPESSLLFEQQLQQGLREMGRQVVQHTFNSLEPDDADLLPRHALHEGTCYTLLRRKTPQHAWTLFGQIRLRRFGYRGTHGLGEPILFPLAHALGLIHGASPALACQIGRLFASAGMTQRLLLRRLRADHGVGWGVKKLRQFLGALAEHVRPVRHDCLVARVLELLGRAQASRGNKPVVLSVGRDGVCLGMRRGKKEVFEVATAATLSVYDRSGKRMGTAYLAQAPESEQARMSEDLTRLVRAVLAAWQGPEPVLCYVTDAGQSETHYYRRVLAVMRHPRTKRRLRWVRVLDYYHASQRVWAMAEGLFGKGRGASSWARKMLKWLLLPGGVNRVLHSAAAHGWRGELRGGRKKAFEKAYNYLRRRMKYLRYAKYRSQGIPVGSGVTEAACKTVYTQRLKLSGMRWGGAKGSSQDGVGPQTVLDLRVLLLSEVWDQAFLEALKTAKVAYTLTDEGSSSDSTAIAG